jgi:transcriptional regulator with XRE-family HTH domain
VAHRDPSLGERIQRARQDAGLSRRQLADRIGRSHASVTYYELDRYVPPLPVAIRIARACGQPLGRLVGEAD